MDHGYCSCSVSISQHQSALAWKILSLWFYCYILHTVRRNSDVLTKSICLLAYISIAMIWLLHSSNQVCSSIPHHVFRYLNFRPLHPHPGRKHELAAPRRSCAAHPLPRTRRSRPRAPSTNILLSEGLIPWHSSHRRGHIYISERWWF